MTLAICAGVAGAWLSRRVKRGGLARELTWDCGYTAPTPRMQYTAGSFAGIITEWFAFILRPVRHDQRPVVIFPVRAGFAEHTPETVLEQVVEPVAVIVMRVSSAMRRLQHGRVQSYVLYLLAGVVMLASWVFIRGSL